MKKKHLLFITAIIASSLWISGCASSGFLAAGNVTNVQLSQANYRLVATSVTGEAESNYLIGVSYGAGLYTRAYALIPLSKERSLYKMAMENLWKNYEDKHGSIQGKQLALINVRYDSEALNVFFYTSQKLFIVADVVEFTK